jgi:heterodisulfide reductase subunit C
MATEMEYPPSVVMRMLQTGDKELSEKILTSNTIWFCLTCEMCYGRCPMEIDIPSIMDYLRGESINQNKVAKGSKNIVAFHKAFLNSIKNNGKLHEMGLVIDYKMHAGNLLQDVDLAPKMYAKGKLHIFPSKNKGMKNIKDIFAKTLKK